MSGYGEAARREESEGYRVVGGSVAGEGVRH